MTLHFDSESNCESDSDPTQRELCFRSDDSDSDEASDNEDWTMDELMRESDRMWREDIPRMASTIVLPPSQPDRLTNQRLAELEQATNVPVSRRFQQSIATQTDVFDSISSQCLTEQQIAQLERETGIAFSPRFRRTLICPQHASR